jgi:hypothetical protein
MRWAKRFFAFVDSQKQSGGNHRTVFHARLSSILLVRFCWFNFVGSIVIDQHQISTNRAGDQSRQNLDRHGFKNAAVQAVEPPENDQCADENAGCPADPGWSVFRNTHARIIPHLERR